MPETIDSFRGEHAFLSNFHPSPLESTIRIGVSQPFVAPTVEHAFQAAKSKERSAQVAVLTARTPLEAKRLGRTLTLRPDWERIKYGVMEHLVRRKFTEHEDLATLLRRTGDAHLLEGNHWHDNIWGDCNCDRTDCQPEGRNHLGLILMKVRGEL